MTNREIRQVMTETVTELSSCLGHRADPHYDHSETVDDENSSLVEALDRWGDRRFGDDRQFRREWVL